jgi:hypothetical protein
MTTQHRLQRRPLSWLLKQFAGLLLICSSAVQILPAAAQQDLPGGGWTYDPAKDGMKSLRNLKPIEGCLAPGGLQRITHSDEPGMSAFFWCGPPPFCLTEPAISVGERCLVLQYARREPRYDPNGMPGVNGVRDPEDLRCENTGLMPINGRCPLPPEVSAAINPETVQVNANTVLTINSPNAASLRMSCVGSNSAFPPYSYSNLDQYAGRSITFDPSRAMLTGVTTCSIRATNGRGSRETTVSFNATAAAPRPTVSASFNPSRPTAGGSVRLTTSTTNATSLRWSCSGRWTNQNTSRAVGNTTTNHTATGSAGTANCTFTATGPGGTATDTASWTSTGSGGSSGGGNEPPIVLEPPRRIFFNYCSRDSANGGNGGGCNVRYAGYLQNGAFVRTGSITAGYGTCTGVGSTNAGITSVEQNAIRNQVNRWKAQAGDNSSWLNGNMWRCRP